MIFELTSKGNEGPRQKEVQNRLPGTETASEKALRQENILNVH